MRPSPLPYSGPEQAARPIYKLRPRSGSSPELGPASARPEFLTRLLCRQIQVWICRLCRCFSSSLLRPAVLPLPPFICRCRRHQHSVAITMPLSSTPSADHHRPPFTLSISSLLVSFSHLSSLSTIPSVSQLPPPIFNRLHRDAAFFFDERCCFSPATRWTAAAAARAPPTLLFGLLSISSSPLPSLHEHNSGGHGSPPQPLSSLDRSTIAALQTSPTSLFSTISLSVERPPATHRLLPSSNADVSLSLTRQIRRCSHLLPRFLTQYKQQ